MDYHGKKILVVDDDHLSCRLTEQTLKDKSFDVLVASSGAQCIRVLQENTVDLILMDIEMPGLNGIETLDIIRKDERFKDIKVIFLTVMMVEGYKTEAKRLNVLDFLQKPVLPMNLIERVSRVFRDVSKQHILVVDDDSMNLRFAQHVLGAHYDVSCASSGPAAIEFLKVTVPSLALLDLHMPEMNGFQLLERVRELPNCKDLPVVFLTADNDRETEIQVFKAGALDYIQKPFVADVVLQRLNRILELKLLQSNLQEEVDRRTAELSESRLKFSNLSMQVVTALAGTIDAKDRYTNGHSKRVAKYSREIARRLNKSPEDVDAVYLIGMLHDIGKIGIPDAIINKTSKLTDEEYEVIKSHTTIGSEILKNISEMPTMKIGARWHHERYDGRGYPDGLKGEEIPEIARIIAVADAYDAMTSRRSYRAALPQEVVRAEIEKGRGKQFDPEFADVMLAMIDDDKDYEMRDDSTYGRT